MVLYSEEEVLKRIGDDCSNDYPDLNTPQDWVSLYKTLKPFVSLLRPGLPQLDLSLENLSLSEESTSDASVLMDSHDLQIDSELFRRYYLVSDPDETIEPRDADILNSWKNDNVRNSCEKIFRNALHHPELDPRAIQFEELINICVLTLGIDMPHVINDPILDLLFNLVAMILGVCSNTLCFGAAAKCPKWVHAKSEAWDYHFRRLNSQAPHCIPLNFMRSFQDDSVRWDNDYESRLEVLHEFYPQAVTEHFQKIDEGDGDFKCAPLMKNLANLAHRVNTVPKVPEKTETAWRRIGSAAQDPQVLAGKEHDQETQQKLKDWRSRLFEIAFKWARLVARQRGEWRASELGEPIYTLTPDEQKEMEETSESLESIRQEMDDRKIETQK